MIRVALVHYRDDASSGGALRVGECLAAHLPRGAVEPSLVFAYGDAGPVTRKTGVPAHFLHASGATDIAAWIRARRLFTVANFDVIHFVDSVLWLTMATYGLGPKKIVHLHGHPISGEPILMQTHIWMRWLRFISDWEISIAKNTTEYCISLGWSNPRRVGTIYNAIDVEHFGSVPDRAVARKVLNLPNDKRLLGFSARLVWWKGPDDMVKVLARLPPEWHGVIAGDGPERPAMMQRATEAGVADRLHFLGVVDDVRPFLAAIDALAFFSRYEPFGLVLAEAMAAGVPIFGLLGAGEYYEKEYPLVTRQNATFVPRAKPMQVRVAEDPAILDAIAKQILEYGKDPHKWSDRTASAKAWVRDRFDGKIQAEHIMRVYARLCGARRAL